MEFIDSMLRIGCIACIDCSSGMALVSYPFPL